MGQWGKLGKVGRNILGLYIQWLSTQDAREVAGEEAEVCGIFTLRQTAAYRCCHLLRPQGHALGQPARAV
jgi:hypothetical protein